MGQADVDDMLESITSAELTEWMELYALEPFGEERADLRAGIIASTIANCNRAKNQPAFKPADFMPRFDGGRGRGKRKTTDELKTRALELCKALGGQVQ